MINLLPTRAARAVVDSSIMFTREHFDKVVENVVIEEAALRDTAGTLPMSDAERNKLRHFVAYRICAEIQPAGNA